MKKIKGIYFAFRFARGNNEKDKSTYNLNVSLSMEEYNISITDKHTVEFGKELDTIDSSKAIDSNSLPDDYGENILKNIKEKLAGTPFESLIDIPDDNSYNDNEYYFDSSY